MESKILHDAVTKILDVGVICHGDFHQPSAIYKILEELVEGVRERAPNTQSKQCQCGYPLSSHICPGDLITYREVCA